MSLAAQSVIGSILIDAACLPVVRPLVTAQDFPLAADRGRNVVLSVGFSALTGYESSNWGNKLLHDGARLRDADCFLYGGALTAEVETYLCDKVVFLVSVRERALAGSTVGTFHTQFGFGFKFIIN